MSFILCDGLKATTDGVEAGANYVGKTYMGHDPSLSTAGGFWVGVGPDTATTSNGIVVHVPSGFHTFVSAPADPANMAHSIIELIFLGRQSALRADYDPVAGAVLLNFFGQLVPVAQPVLTGINAEIAAVTDANAKAALGKIVAALVALGLCTAT